MNSPQDPNPAPLANAKPPSRLSIVALSLTLAIGLASLWALFELQRMPYRPPEDLTPFFADAERLVIFSIMTVIGVLWLLGASSLLRLLVRRYSEIRPDAQPADQPLHQDLNAITETPVRPQVSRRLWVYPALAIALLACAGLAITLIFRPREFPPLKMSFNGNSTSLARTRVVPTLDTPIEKGRNLIWCAAFQCAWKKLQTNVTSGPISLEGASEACDRLNAAPDPAADISPESIYANAGLVSKDIISIIQREMKAKFPAAPLPQFPDAAPDGAVAYAHVQAGLSFTIPYFQSRQPLEFVDSSGKRTSLRAFGLRPGDQARYFELRQQVRLLYVASANDGSYPDFAIDLCRNSQPDQLVIACIEPAATLEKTLESLNAKIQAWKPGRYGGPDGELQTNDELLIPDMFWRISHHFAELEGRRFQDPRLSQWMIARATQDIQFRLDRSGVELKAKAGIVPASVSAILYANRPFLVYLKKRDAQRPYFVIWIDNPELLQPWPAELKPPKR